MPNHLINETSPYLQQHAHQPVDWYPYSESIFEKGEQENKPLIISIGYSTCHWCHVMAHECFDDKEIAEIMNQNFINVKVDREELPDVDKYYMNAIQVLTGRGGWPLNAFVLPNKKAFYAVTYLPKDNWKNLLLKIIHLYHYEKNKLNEYAENIHRAVLDFELSPIQTSKTTDTKNVQQIIEKWKTLFDKEYGGHTYVPKFVMPVNFKFFLHYLQFIKDSEVQQHLNTSIEKICLGGLFDHIEGGFYRYSTDKYWKIPHFEKMLYDNAQMIELLSLYYLNFLQPHIKWILEKNIQFILKNFLSDEFLFYSAQDADSEGEEGKFYVWTKEELKNILKEEYEAFAEMFNIHNEFGYWENDNYVLTINEKSFKENISENIQKINQWTQLLNQYRKRRTPPLTDTKIITSWNALMIKALAIASVVLKNHQYLEIAEKSTNTLLNKLFVNNQLYKIYHKGQVKNPAYLDDYAFLIDALITLSKTTSSTHYLNIAITLTEQVINKFYSHKHNIFYYTSIQHSIKENVELYDDVIPSANAQMITNLLYLYHLNNNSQWKDIAQKTYDKSFHLFFDAFYHSASYGILILQNKFLNELELSISGKEAKEYFYSMYHKIWYINNTYIANSKASFDIFQNRFHSQRTFIYVCQHSTCYEPVENPDTFNLSDFIHF